MIRTLLLGLVLAGWSVLPAGAQQSSSHIAFVAGLARVDELVAEKEYREAKQALDLLLRQHEGQVHALARRQEVLELYRLCAWYQQRRMPKLDELLSGDLKRYSETTGNIDITYRRKRFGDFVYISGDDKGKPAKGFYKPSQTTLMYPGVFAGTYEVSLDGRDYLSQPAVVIVGAEAGQMIVCNVWYDMRNRRFSYLRGELAVFEDGERTVLDSYKKQVDAERSYEVKVEVSTSGVSVRFGKKRILRCRMPDGYDHGRFGFSNWPGLDELRVKGKLEPSWIQGLQDQAMDKQYQDFVEEFEEGRPLPEWLYCEPGNWSFDFASRELPDLCRSEDEDAVKKILVALETGLGQLAGKAIEKLEEEMPRDSEGRGVLLYFDALEQLRKGRWKELHDTCQSFLALEPWFDPLLRLRAYAYYRLREAGLEEELVEAYPLRNRSDSWSQAYYALAALHSGDLERTRGLIDASIREMGLTGPVDDVAGFVVKAERGPSWEDYEEYVTDHYVVRSDLDRRTCIQAGKMLETVLGYYERDLGKADFEEGQRFPVYIFSGRSSYEAYLGSLLGRTPESTAGVYVPYLKQLVVWNLPERESLFATLRHEGFHQYIDARMGDIPLWLNEGLAEYWGGADLTRMESRRHQGDPQRLQQLRVNFRVITNLRSFTKQSSAQFMSPGRVSLNYAQAWAFLHFLLRESKENRELFGRLIAELDAGEAPRQAVSRAFDDVDWRELDRRFLIYVKELLR